MSEPDLTSPHPDAAPHVPPHPRIGSLCSGYGGLDMAVENVLGGQLAWVADTDPTACKILAAHYPDVPNHGDITKIDWALVEPVDVITAGFPCQDISTSGARAGIKEGTRSGIWRNVAQAVRVIRPALLFVENVAAIRSKGLDIVLADLAALRYDAQWTCVRASDIGAPHARDRFFLIAWPAS